MAQRSGPVDPRLDRAEALIGAAIILASVIVVVRSDANQAAAASGKLLRSS